MLYFRNITVSSLAYRCPGEPGITKLGDWKKKKQKQFSENIAPIVLLMFSLKLLSHLKKDIFPRFLWWLSGRVCLIMQETLVQFLIQEDPICLGATEPGHHNYWVCALEPGNRNCWSPWALEPVLRSKRSHPSEKPGHHTWRVAPICHNYRKACAAMTQPRQKSISQSYLFF